MELRTKSNRIQKTGKSLGDSDKFLIKWGDSGPTVTPWTEDVNSLRRDLHRLAQHLENLSILFGFLFIILAVVFWIIIYICCLIYDIKIQLRDYCSEYCYQNNPGYNQNSIFGQFCLNSMSYCGYHLNY